MIMCINLDENVARSILDKDDEHIKEAQRRIDAAEICKKNIEVSFFF